MNGYHGIYHPHPGPGPLRRRRRRRPKDSLGHQEVIVRIDLNTGRFLPSPRESRREVTSPLLSLSLLFHPSFCYLSSRHSRRKRISSVPMQCVFG